MAPAAIVPILLLLAGVMAAFVCTAADAAHIELAGARAVLALPLAPVCREDCPGLCPRCGARLADVDQGHRHDEVDPRWAALRAVGATDRQRIDEDQES